MLFGGFTAGNSICFADDAGCNTVKNCDGKLIEEFATARNVGMA